MALMEYTVEWTYHGEPRRTSFIKPLEWEMGLAAIWKWAATGLYGSSPCVVTSREVVR